MPFGLSTAGFIFTQILRVLVLHWRDQGIALVTFFDDGLSAAIDFPSALANSHTVLETLLRAGFIPNVDKSQWYPAQVIMWLGFWYDLVMGVIRASDEKIEKCQMLRTNVHVNGKIHVKAIAAFLGMLTSLHPAFGDIVYLKAKHLQILLASQKLENKKQNWDCYVKLNQNCQNELMFWKNYMPHNNGMKIHISIESGTVSFSDASDSGTAALITPAPGCKEVKVIKAFNKYEKQGSSTYRELLAVVHGLTETKHLLKNKNLR